MSRNLSLDYLRNFANLSRCLLHASIPYMVTYAPVWPVNENGSWFFDFAVFEIHLFVMELFFVIAGFVFAIQLQKQTTLSLFIDRTKRILDHISFIITPNKRGNKFETLTKYIIDEEEVVLPSSIISTFGI